MLGPFNEMNTSAAFMCVHACEKEFAFSFSLSLDVCAWPFFSAAAFSDEKPCLSRPGVYFRLV